MISERNKQIHAKTYLHFTFLIPSCQALAYFQVSLAWRLRKPLPIVKQQACASKSKQLCKSVTARIVCSAEGKTHMHGRDGGECIHVGTCGWI